MLNNKNTTYTTLTNDLLPAVQACVQMGFLVVLIGLPGTGKSVLAEKTLPSARILSGLPWAPKPTGVADTDLIGDELFSLIDSDDFIQQRNQALALGHRVIITGQRWPDVIPYLAGLPSQRYKVFDLNRVWGLPSSNIPAAVLAG